MRKAAEFFEYARKREAMRIEKEDNVGTPPWTTDSTLATYRFCNVFREDDRTTRWFDANVRRPLRVLPEKVVRATLLFRWFNKIETGEVLLPWLLKPETYNRQLVEAALRTRAATDAVFSGAYIIKSPNGKDKITGILDCYDAADEVIADVIRFTHPCYIQSLESTHARLMDIPFIGRFMAYELVTDLYHTTVLDRATDAMTWASAGPGAARGCSWVVEGVPKPQGYGYASDIQQQRLLAIMKELLDLSHKSEYWPQEWRAWDMRTVEHTLCEFDKYCRAQGGQTLKRKYR